MNPIFALLLGLWKGAGTITSIPFKFIKDHLGLCLGVLVLLGSNFFVWKYTTSYVEAADAVHYGAVIQGLEDKVRIYNQSVRDTKAKVTELETTAATLTKALATERVLYQKSVTEIVSGYEDALTLERSRLLSGTCKVSAPTAADPNFIKEIEVQLEEGDLVCRRFYDTFRVKVNSLVDLTNAKAVGEAK